MPKQVEGKEKKDSVITASMEESLANAAKERAEDEGVPFSWWLRKLLIKELGWTENQKQIEEPKDE